MKETELMLTVELQNQYQLGEIIRKYEAIGWKFIDRGCFTKHGDILRVTIEFRANKICQK
ncbi:hypothetical protein ACT29H_09325 [Thermophagus sp. OGC60D27]|uniref:hypothetical protein n=1 Tax=Thermophagus sp. OGC60D27 TaxID=3458415 RepID=UPI004037BF4F